VASGLTFVIPAEAGIHEIQCTLAMPHDAPVSPTSLLFIRSDRYARNESAHSPSPGPQEAQ